MTQFLGVSPAMVEYVGPVVEGDQLWLECIEVLVYNGGSLTLYIAWIFRSGIAHIHCGILESLSSV